MSCKEEMESWRVQSPEEAGFHAVITPDTCACQETQIFRLNLPKGESYHLESGKLEMHPVLIAGAAKLSDHALAREMKRFDAPTERISDPVPVLYQSGYLTIKDFDSEENTFTLGFPNAEVREGFGDSLYNYYSTEYIGSRDLMSNAFRDLRRKRTTFEQFLESVRKWYAGLPYDVTDKNQNEQFYQALFYALLVGMGADVHAEEKTSDGRIDISLKMPDAIYIMEFKYGKTSQEALEQILSKDYAVRFAYEQRPVYAVGLNVSNDRRTIDSYDVVQVKA